MPPSDDPVTVVVAGPHTLLRRGIAGLLKEQPGIRVVDEARCAETLVGKATLHRPDVALVDLLLPTVLRGLGAIGELRRASGGTRALLLTAVPEVRHGVLAVRAGAKGYLSTFVDPDELARSIGLVADGQLVLERSLSDSILREVTSTPPGALTPREHDVLRLVAHGLDNESIAGRLAICVATVRTHLGHIMSKLDVHSRVEMVLYALREGHVSVEELRRTSS